MNPDPNERRKAPRRSGVGRRIHGDRRRAEQPGAILPGWIPRQEQRRTQKRRFLLDRRSRNANARN